MSVIATAPVPDKLVNPNVVTVAAAGVPPPSIPSNVPVNPVPVTCPVNAAVVVPVSTPITSASASFFIVTSLVEPCPVKIRPSAAV